MIWAAYMGLPLSLAGTGAVLGLDEQKLKEGKDLIRYFCIPCKATKVNGGRTRNLPEHDINKWNLFKFYNKRDVEVEMSIQDRLKNYPVPDFVWDEYHLDQEINDRGIALDMKVVTNAIAFDAKSKAVLVEKMQKLTNLDNPNSVVQMKQWLADHGMAMDSLGKKEVAQAVKTAPQAIADVLILRQQLAKSSVKKYQAMQHAACEDGRARGMFQFYGANRTGRWCLTGDHEVLTDKGWERLDRWNGGIIACWNPQGEAVSFQKAKQLMFPYKGDIYLYEDKRISQISTPDHRMYVKKRYGDEWTMDTVENMAGYRPSIPFTGYRQINSGLEHNKLRVMVMVQADGHYCDDGTIKLGFTKSRKAERCKALLRAANIQYSYKVYSNNPKPRLQFNILARNVPLWLRQFREKTFGTWLFDESADVFFDELVYWDGCRSAKNSIQYVTCNKQNADIVQAFAHISGRTASVKTKVRSDKHPNWSDAYYVDIWLTPINCHEIRTKPIITDFEGYVYCAETPTGYFLVRRNGRVWVTGNSGRLIQLQNLPQNHMPDLEQARSLVQCGDYDAMELLYDDIPDTLSQLIRTAFVPRDGMKFVVADFSAIEARVLSFLAGEKWKSKAFEEGEDIYCSTASKMFGVPVEKHGVNGHLRQKGKIAELACIAEGELVLTNQGLVPIEDVTKNQLLWDGENWVQHDGVIYKGEREVIEYDGLRATADHFVWVEGKSQPVQFGIAATCGAHLLQTGNGRQTIRLGENNIGGKTMEQGDESLLCVNGMPRLPLYTMARIGKPKKWKVKRVSTMFTETENSFVVGSPIDSSETTLRKSIGQRISQLWRERNTFQFCKCNRSRSVYDKEFWTPGARNGDRPNRYEQPLSTGESEVCDTSRKLYKSTENGVDKIRAAILAICKKCSHKKADSGDESGRDYCVSRTCSVRKEKELASNTRTARLYDIRNAGQHHRFTVSGKLVHNCGYGGSVGALKAMGALDMGLAEEELQPLVDSWRAANPNIVRFWWDVDRCVKNTVQRHMPTETTWHSFCLSEWDAVYPVAKRQTSVLCEAAHGRKPFRRRSRYL
jgi:hypothetical protein